ncbi:efflux RND transporter periplasmic adaptor subunit [Sphingobacterium alkalisoli]|uniref:Efflux RND transporter periplasmic adaptor subunit n=1 Tax=Sphingobacterium alkalisoli TaxID=1874115 RepID=A0A4U0GWI0_9SPHI|nr:efflux RND transporter periplasmic adaptor subunit [Sphingobacterium alkalisoli]TJY63447.1 efflux RND transporter periplasmic adaptor subunit [Sphingobacterium alkalisoli]GGH26134.1 RND transporter [Sphingobacterium alkalisoli]
MKKQTSTNFKRKTVSILNGVKFSNYVKMLYVVSVSFLYSCSTGTSKPVDSPPPALPVITISSADETVYQEYPASIEGAANVEIRPQVSGALDRIYIDEGAKVHQGQLLFKINDRPYQEQLNQAKANLQAAEAARENAELEVEKKIRLVENKVLTDFQLKAAQSALSVANASVQQAKSAVESAKINLDYTQIRATSAGYIGRLLKKQGSLVNPADAEPLTQLSDVHTLHVYFSLSENDFIDFKRGVDGQTLEQKLQQVPPVALVLSDQSIYEHTGKIDMVDGQFDKNTGAITLRATFSNPAGILRNGNTGRIRLEKQYHEILLVPQLATVEIQDKIFVYAVNDDHKVIQQPITVVGKSGENYLVDKGLKSGDRIVYKGIELLQDGQVINPVIAEKENIQ